MVNDAALRQVFGAYLAAPKRPAGSVFIDTSTVAPALTAELAAQAKEHGIGKCVPLLRITLMLVTWSYTTCCRSSLSACMTLPSLPNDTASQSSWLLQSAALESWILDHGFNR